MTVWRTTDTEVSSGRRYHSVYPVEGTVEIYMADTTSQRICEIVC